MTEEQKILSGQICPHCNCETTLVSDKEIYGPESTYGGMYYRCNNDNDHYVGTYSNNVKSLGRLADKELRAWKMKGHKAFDPLWREEPKYLPSQRKAYDWLALKMGIDLSLTHFGMFTIGQCKEAIQFCMELKGN